jgi:hypothetical protein
LGGDESFFIVHRRLSAPFQSGPAKTHPDESKPLSSLRQILSAASRNESQQPRRTLTPMFPRFCL